ncbi:kinase-like protein [Annulohypoxylon truncatum]|uniref:kinase-like protein n=1 Tax=Annulohypoxylon truncatum TaxID=327061 RepID=UPI002008D26A|nr:kinase-like protein [Annulohypoxylon truncatum]KAI1215195.1 kinase-like protein [Annulohypoxylon truncatum]
MEKDSSPAAESVTRQENPIDTHGGIENFQMYNKGGYHPVQLDDILDNRFLVIHKLGSGGFGTVWLCRDLNLNKWRAVKIIAASRSFGTGEEKVLKYLRENFTLEELEENHIVVPLEEFYIEGPNGRHRCLVMPVLGSTVSIWRLLQINHKEQTGIDAKIVCRQIIEALDFLHRHGICHGDYRPNNILMKVEGIDELDEDQMINLMGEPNCIDIETMSGQSPAPRAPEYAVLPAVMNMDWFKAKSTMTVAVIDFGESFFVKSPPKSTGIPNEFASPEVLFRGSQTLGLPSDIWSLACTLFEVRTRTHLFPPGGWGVIDTVKEIEFILGPLPLPYRRVYEKKYLEKYGKGRDEDEQNPSKPIPEYGEILIGRRSAKRSEFIEESGYADIFEAILGEERFAYDDEKSQNITYRYPRNEVIELANLLRNMVKYDPDERMKIGAVLSHSWVRAEPPSTIHSNSVPLFAMITWVMDQRSDVEVIDNWELKPEELSEPLKQLALHLNP